MSKMNFKQFAEEVKNHLLEGWREDAALEIKPVYKENGKILTSLIVFRKEEKLNPTFYLEPYFQNYQEGYPIHVVLVKLRADYDKACEDLMEESSMPNFENWEDVKDRLILRLVNFQRSREMFESGDVIYERFLEDMAVTIRCVVKNTEEGMYSVLVERSLADHWGVTDDEILKIAKANTGRLYPPVFFPLDSFVEEEEGSGECEEINPIFGLTNKAHFFGATSLILTNALTKIGEKFGNLYLVPNCVHEIIVLPEALFPDPSVLASILYDANRSEIKEEDFLSDTVYMYRASDDCLAPVSLGDNQMLS